MRSSSADNEYFDAAMRAPLLRRMQLLGLRYFRREFETFEELHTGTVVTTNGTIGVSG